LRKPRLVYLITQGVMGGAQTHIRHLALSLRDRYDVHVAIGDREFLWRQLQEEGIPVHHLPLLVRPVAPDRDVGALQQIVELFKRLQPDLVSTHCSKAGLLGRLAARLCHIPAIYTPHGWAFSDGVPEAQRRSYLIVERIASRWSEKIICVSDYELQLALRHHVGGGPRLITIHNGMPPISDDLQARPGGGEPVRLVMVARFAEPKDHRLLITAISQVRTNNAFRLLLIGDGPLVEQCKGLAARLGVIDRTIFLGARADVAAQLATAHIFVLTTRWEGFPRSILEAMRAGLPVIASDVGGSKESVLEGETGFLIPRGDLETLKTRLVTLIDEPDLRALMGSSGRNRFLNNFTFDQMVTRTEAVYREVLAKA